MTGNITGNIITKNITKYYLYSLLGIPWTGAVWAEPIGNMLGNVITQNIASTIAVHVAYRNSQI